jgi:hypothetical protein
LSMVFRAVTAVVVVVVFFLARVAVGFFPRPPASRE